MIDFKVTYDSSINDIKTLNPFVASSTLASPTTTISLFLIISTKI